jgi:hypothetical protein
MENVMNNVTVYHVGSPTPMVIPNADFRTEGGGGDLLVIVRGTEVVARFPAGKWSAVAKTAAPASSTA